MIVRKPIRAHIMPTGIKIYLGSECIFLSKDDVDLMFNSFFPSFPNSRILVMSSDFKKGLHDRRKVVIDDGTKHKKKV